MKSFLIFAGMLAAVSASAGAGDLRVRLRAEVTVQSGTLRLSDLLPADVGAQFKAAAEKTVLGTRSASWQSAGIYGDRTATSDRRNPQGDRNRYTGAGGGAASGLAAGGGCSEANFGAL